jgi:hypothetical protein
LKCNKALGITIENKKKKKAVLKRTFGKEKKKEKNIIYWFFIIDRREEEIQGSYIWEMYRHSTHVSVYESGNYKTTT